MIIIIIIIIVVVVVVVVVTVSLGREVCVLSWFTPLWSNR
jgi:hypothetical protein